MRTDELEVQQYTRQSTPTARDVAAVLFRQRWPMLIAFVAVILAAAASGMWIPKYEAHMKILVQRQRPDAIITASPNGPAQLMDSQITEEDINSEVELLNSDDLLRKVVLATGLSGVPASAADRNNLKVAKAVRALSKDLKIEPLHNSNVISVKYSNRNPEMATNVLKTLAAAYTEKHLELHRSSGEFKFFDQQTQQYQQRLDQAQAKLTNFTKGTGVVSAQLQRDSALQEASEFDATAHQAQASVLETEQRVSALQNQLESMQPRVTTEVSTSDNPQLLQQLKSTLLDLELKRTELLTKYQPTYRLVKQTDQQIAEAKSAIDSEESKPIRAQTTNQNPDYQWAQTELTKNQADLSGLKARAAAAAAIAAQYHKAAQRLNQDGLVQQDLLQAAKTQEDNYLLYVRKREEARINDALDQRGIVNVVLAEQPVVPALPTRSPLSAALLMFLLAGTASLSTAFVVDFMDPTFRTPDELANHLEMPVLAALPKGGE